jgi:acylphosphatase
VAVIRNRVLVSGRVQGVYFRDTCRRLALRYGLSGWVRNLPDGRVEAVFEGSADAVHRLVAWTREGPDSAIVTGVVVHGEPPEGLRTFVIR